MPDQSPEALFAAFDVKTIGEPLVPTALRTPPLRMISTRLESVPKFPLSPPARQRTTVPGKMFKMVPVGMVTSPVISTTPAHVTELVIAPETVPEVETPESDVLNW